MKVVSSPEEFESKVATQNLMLVTVGAKWCRPCNQLKPLLEELSQKYPDIEFLKVDVDITPTVAEGLGVSAFPSTMFICGKNKSQVIRGANIGQIVALLSTAEEFKSKCVHTSEQPVDRGDENCGPDSSKIV